MRQLNQSTQPIKQNENPHLVNKLKQEVKYLKNTISDRDKQIADLKKDRRLAVSREYSSELQMYMEECHRLR